MEKETGSARVIPLFFSAQSIRALFAFLHWTVLLALFGFLTAKAFLEFNITSDFVGRHLPLALQMLHRTTFEFNERGLMREAGFPHLPNLVQAALILLSGRISGAEAVNAVGFLSAAGIIKFVFGSRFSLRWFLTFCLAVPLFLFHYVIGYIDLFTNAMILIAFAGFFGLATGQRPRWSGWIAVVGSLGAMFSKMQAWPVIALYALVGLVLLQRAVQRGWLTRNHGLALLIGLVLAVSYYPVRNCALFGNPTYPIQPPFFHLQLPSYRGAEEPLEKPPYLEGAPYPVIFLHSAFELHRLYTDEPYVWQYDPWTSEKSNHKRMGGWFYATVILFISFLLYGGVTGIMDRRMLALHGLSIVLFSFIPNAHNLRYSLFIPLVSFFLLAYYLPKFPSWAALIMKLGFVACALYVMTQLKLVQPNILWGENAFWGINTQPPVAYAAPVVREFWNEHMNQLDQVFVISDDANAYLPAFLWSGPTFNEVRVKPPQ